ncbi:hypothetical protein J4558_20875 [Leptolyngbya sp. 15MV]|nr:hypothetical protein J4558_20875 [Leptolyngbya sp. 15MV]
MDLALLVKKYVKSLYGTDSPQYKQISAASNSPAMLLLGALGTLAALRWLIPERGR